MFQVNDYVIILGGKWFGMPGLVTGYGAGFADTYRVTIGEEVETYPGDQLEMLYRLMEGEFIAVEEREDEGASEGVS
jgi:hypothetical protein